MDDEIKIPLNKAGIVLMFIGALLFVAGGIWVAMIPILALDLPGILQGFPPPALILIGLASILFFGLCAASMFQKLFISKAGLILKDDGFWDNSSGVSAGFISWEQVLDIDVLTVASQRFIIVLISDPEEIIKKQKGFKRFMMKQNYKHYNTPIHISTNPLKIDFDKLLNLFKSKYREYYVKANQ